MTRRLVLVDFDGTVTRGDSFFPFLWHAHSGAGRWWRLGGAFFPWLRYKLGLWDAHRAKEAIFRIFFRGWSREEFERYAARFARSVLPSMERPAAMRRLAAHLRQGDAVWLVSASPAPYLRAWAASAGIGVIATEVEYDAGGRLTGRFASPNCRGPEKVRRIRAALRLEEYDEIIAYGDSPEDRPMLALAHRAYYRPFREEAA